MSKMILIIEDEESIQNIIKAFLEDAGYTVVLAADGMEEGCTFNANGKIVNDQIEVPLQTANPDLKSTMVIRSTGAEGMNVFTSRAADKNDLGLFCSDGKTLAGDYVKAK